MDQQIQHVITLATNLKTGLDPIEGRGLKEFSRLEGSEQVATQFREKNELILDKNNARRSSNFS